MNTTQDPFLEVISRPWPTYGISSIRVTALQCIPPSEGCPEGYSAQAAVAVLRRREPMPKTDTQNHCAYWFATGDGRRGYGDSTQGGDLKLIENGDIADMPMPRLVADMFRAHGEAVTAVAVIVEMPVSLFPGLEAPAR